MKISNRFPLLYLLACLCGLGMLDLEGYQAAILLLLMASVLAVITHRKDRMLSPALFISVAYVVAYSVPILFPFLYPTLLHEVSTQAVENGMLWAARGFGAFALGYALIELFGDGSMKPMRQGEVLHRDQMIYAVYVFTGIGWLSILAWATNALFFGISLTFIEGEIIRTDSVAGTAQQILGLLAGLRNPFFLGFLVMYLLKITDRHLYGLFAVQFLIGVVEIVAIGSKGSIITAVVVGLLALTLLPVKLSTRQFVVGILALIAVYTSFAVITEYRSLMHAEREAGRNVFDFAVQAESFGNAVIASLPFSDLTADRRTEVKREDVFKRLGDGIFSFSNLLEFTGRVPPYENALESFLVPIYSITPRALLPDKPEFFHSGRNAREYYRWTYGGISVTLLGSLYFAWGYPGIVIGMALIGSLLAYVARQTRLMGTQSPHWLVLFPILVLAMMDVGIIFQAIITNLIRVALLLWLLHLLYPLLRKPMLRRMSRIVNQVQPARHA